MTRHPRGSIRAIAAVLLLASAPVLHAQNVDKSADTGKAVVAIYRVAPGKHLDMLKWFAAREAIDKEAGIRPTQWYVHTDGDSWDFVSIAPQLSDAESAKVDELSKKKGLKTGFPAALEFRQFVSSHTDTFARGPTTAADLVKEASDH
jgi:hypothetical protein